MRFILPVLTVVLTMVMFSAYGVQSQAANCDTVDCVYLPALISAPQPTPTLPPITPAPTPTTIPRQNGIYIHSHRILREEDAVYVAGEIVNGTSQTISVPFVTIALVDPEGDVILTGSATGLNGLLRPGERAPFTTIFGHVPYALDLSKTKLLLGWRTDWHFLVNYVALEVVDWSIEPSGDKVRATIFNPHERSVYSANIYIVYYEDDGSVYAVIPRHFTASFNIDPLQIEEVIIPLDDSADRFFDLTSIDKDGFLYVYAYLAQD